MERVTGPNYQKRAGVTNPVRGAFRAVLVIMVALSCRRDTKTRGGRVGSVRRRVADKLRQVRGSGSEPAWSAERNIVITGPGRSGTTLTCHLLNKLPNTVALSEPINPGKYADRLPDTDAVADGIQDFYREQRRMALNKGIVLSKHVGGVVPDNPKGMVDGVRKRVVEKGKISVGKDLSPDFFLGVKQTGIFTAMLPTLVNRFACFAIVRNPLAIRASSMSIESDKKGRKDRASARITYDATLGERMEAKKSEGADVIDKWLLRMHSSYQQSLPPENIIRYEDLCESNGRALSVIVPAAAELDEPLENKNKNPLYKRDKILRYGERMLQSEGAYWDFYTRESVEEIMDGLQ
jgi:hypothetical protein